MSKIPVRTKVILLLCLLGVVGWYIFVPRPPLPPGHVPPPAPDHFPLQPGQDAGATTALRARVLEYGSGEKGDIDRILVESAGAKHWVYFPPHAARAVLNLAALKSEVIVGVQNRPGGRQEITTISSGKSGQKVALRDIHPPRPSRGKEVTVSGLWTDETTSGPERSFRVQDNLVVLPPQAGEAIFGLLKRTRKVEVSGYERDPADGFVNASGLKVIRAYSVRIDSVTYLVH